MKTYEQPMEGNFFQYDGNDYDCKRAVRKDIESTVRQAEATHKDAFHRLYKTFSDSTWVNGHILHERKKEFLHYDFLSQMAQKIIKM